MKKSLSTEKFSQQQSVLFFDGVCNLCNFWVDFLIRQDSEGQLRFAPLQGETAKAILPSDFTEHLHSLVFVQDGAVYDESTAAIKVLAQLGGPWRLGCALLVIPSVLRNAVYRFVARHRYDWFGQRETCRLPTAEERARFLP